MSKATMARAEKTESWSHQREALAFALEHLAAMLHMGMGTGKTRIVIDLLCKGPIKQQRRALVLCPLSVVPVWESEVRKHWHDGVSLEAVYLSRGSVAKKKSMASALLYDNGRAPDVKLVVINYESARVKPFRGWALDQVWDLVVLDEAHKIKSPGGKASTFCGHSFKRSLRQISRRRLCLTGTPMPHSPLDVYAQFRFLDPSIFGRSFVEFRAEYAVMGGFNGRQVLRFKNQEKLARKMSAITFQARSEDVLDLPPETTTTRSVELEPRERKAYDEMEKEFVADVEGGVVTAANALVRLLRLQQVTSGYLSDGGEHHRLGNSKRKVLEEALEAIGREPVVVFCKFTHDLNEVWAAAHKAGRDYVELSGRRKDVGAVWQRGDIAGVQIQAGGVGIDLTRARYAVYYSTGFSLGDYLQSRARVRRPGQERPVTYIHLVARDSVDEKVLHALRSKERVVESVLSQLARR